MDEFFQTNDIYKAWHEFDQYSTKSIYHAYHRSWTRCFTMLSLSSPVSFSMKIICKMIENI